MIFDILGFVLSWLLAISPIFAIGYGILRLSIRLNLVEPSLSKKKRDWQLARCVGVSWMIFFAIGVWVALSFFGGKEPGDSIIHQIAYSIMIFGTWFGMFTTIPAMIGTIAWIIEIIVYRHSLRHADRTND